MFKSIKTGVVAAILVSTAFYAQAQKSITEGTAVYTVKYSLPAEMAQMEGMLPTESKTVFKNNFSKTVMEQGPALITVIADKSTESGLLLLDVPVAQMQYAVKMTKADIDKTKVGAPVYSDFKATGEKKVIATYNAEKYTHTDDKGQKYELWVTQDIELPASMKEDEFKTVKGTPVMFSSFRNGITSTLTLKSIKEEKIGDLTLTPPSGYELKTMAELEAMQQGGG